METEFDPAEDLNNESNRKVTDSIRKVITAGLGAAFMTEESIRAYVKDVKLPKDVVNYLVKSATQSKEELMDRVGNEIVKVISKIDFVSEASKFVEEHKFKISAEVEVIRKDNENRSYKIDVKSKAQDS